MSAVEFVSDDPSLQNRPKFAKIPDYVVVFPSSWHLANKKPHINHCTLLKTDSSQKIFFFQCLLCVFKFPDTLLIILGVLEVRMYYSGGGKHLARNIGILVYLRHNIIREKILVVVVVIFVLHFQLFGALCST